MCCLDVRASDHSAVGGAVPVPAQVRHARSAQELRLRLHRHRRLHRLIGHGSQGDHAREQIMNLGLIALTLLFVELEVEAQNLGQHRCQRVPVQDFQHAFKALWINQELLGDL